MSQSPAIKTNNELTYKKKMRPSERRNLWIGRIFIWIMIVLTMFPIVAIFSASLAKGDTFTQTTFFPAEWGFQNYTKVIKETDFLLWVKNSLIICTSVATIQILITLPAAFSFSRLRFKGRRNGLMSLLILQMFPAMMAIPAILAIAYRLEAMDNIFMLIILLSAGSAYNIWLLKGFIDGIPKDLDEAAFVDGATTWQMFTRIILPLTKNMLLVIFLFSFIGVYSEFILTSALMKDSSTQTVATGLRTFINNNFSANWTQYSAAAIMASLPVVIIFVSLQKFISKGLVAGAVKG
ncbi:carbohydrate ABC transporter membrane protein 2, CUT1 family [Clostridium amylolyticum]|uniref:Carbohydrate ABC transporter membrane protein 2, CUT1 family n=1 Tax=Clostridium amylolyticum TaxID=1121298 RepID=A0A1M6B275_9CLOT|nr:sugar ABC transporter permease [Clostridium amylolyticum]SHI42780.1 carbohydrate ABC transporter membrane protein 2, CUT1 family [Clostridium amylolyticum]